MKHSAINIAEHMLIISIKRDGRIKVYSKDEQDT